MLGFIFGIVFGREVRLVKEGGVFECYGGKIGELGRFIFLGFF